MVDRVNLSKLVDYLIQTQKRERKEDREIRDREEIKVSLSKVAKSLENVQSEGKEIKKMERIRKLLKEGNYEVSEEKIKEGLERFFL